MSPMGTDHRRQLVEDRHQQLAHSFADARRARRRVATRPVVSRPARAGRGLPAIRQTLKRISITSPSATS
jgi:hypothetical protein